MSPVDTASSVQSSVEEASIVGDGTENAAPMRSGAVDPTLREAMAAAAHDINNALNSTLVASHLLQLTATDPDAVRRHADRIAQAARQGVAAAARITALLRANASSASSPVSEPHA